MRKYEKPLFRREKGMQVIFKTVRGNWPKLLCRGCSSCHGCRG